MNEVAPSKLTHALFFFFALFIFGSTFSIALAQIALGLALALFLTVIIIYRYQPFVQSLKYFYALVAIFIGWMLICGLMGESVSRSLLFMKENWLFLIIPIGIFLMQNKMYRDRLMTVFAIGVVMISIYGLLQYSLGLNWFRDTALTPADIFGYRVRGNFTHRLTFGNYYATAALFLFGYAFHRTADLSKSMRQLFLLAAILGMTVTVLSFCRGSIFGMVAGLILLGLILGRKYLAGIVGSLVVVILAAAILLPGLVNRFNEAVQRDLSLEFEDTRPFIWKNSLSIIYDNPLFGIGDGNFRDEYVARLRPDLPYWRKYSHAHNDLINNFALYGVPGGLLFVGMWVVLFGYTYGRFRQRRSFEEKDRFFLAAILGSVAFFASSLSEATFADEEVRQLLMFIWAAGLYPLYNEQRKTKETRQ